MFYGGRFKKSLPDLKRQLRKMIVPPIPHVPLNPFPAIFQGLDRYTFQKVRKAVEPLALGDLERIVQFYIDRENWDYAFASIAATYLGELESLVKANVVWFQGAPGRSRVWWRNETVLLPVPMTGVVRSTLETWWALSGGYYAINMITVDRQAWWKHLVSLAGPIVLHWPSENPVSVATRLMRCFEDKRGYPILAENALQHPEHKPYDDKWLTEHCQMLPSELVDRVRDRNRRREIISDPTTPKWKLTRALGE
jgi:hypothetical protein